MQKKFFTNLLLPLYLLLWLSAALYLGSVHEPFADEAQAYLIARDASFSELFARLSRVEGTPPLWFLWLKLWLALGLPYTLLYITSVLPNFAAVVLFVCKSPFSAPVRFLFPLTYYAFYQYNIVSRNYNLLFLAVAAVASAYRSRRKAPLWYAAALMFMGLVCLHALVLSGALALMWLCEIRASRRKPAAEKPQTQCSARLSGQEKAAFGLLALYALGCIAMLWPAPSNEYVANFINQPAYIIRNIYHLLSVGLIVSVRSVPENLLYIYAGIIYFLCMGVLLARCFKKEFCFLLCPLLAFMSVVPFKPWHAGILVFAVLLICWLHGGEKRYPPLWRRSVAVLFAVQVCWSGYAFVYDKNGAYSAGRAVYEFIRQQGFPTDKIVPAMFNAVSVVPYGDTGFGSYWDWRKHGYARKLEEEQLKNCRAFIVNGEYYEVYRQSLEARQKEYGFKVKEFPSRHFFAATDKSWDETLYVYYKGE